MRIKLLNERAKIPTRATEGSAGYDLYAANEFPVEIPIGETVSIPLGFATELPINTYAAIYARSGLSIRDGLRPANCVGIIDPDYRGEWIVALHNDSSVPKMITAGDRIAQVLFGNIVFSTFEPVDELPDTARGNGGFGSTGV